MATKAATKKTGKPGTDVAPVAPKSLVPAGMFEQDAGAGMEGVDADSVAIPMLRVLQKGSPQVDETHPAYIEVPGAKSGSVYDNVAQQAMDGKEGIEIIPCAFRRSYIRWAPRDESAGFKGELSVSEVANLRESGAVVELERDLLFPNAAGEVNPKTCDRLHDTRNHYVLFRANEDDAWKPALLALTSTQIKKSRMLLAALGSVKVQGANGAFTPPTFANVVRMTTVAESNDKGSWHGVRFQLEGTVQDPDAYAQAKEFHNRITENAVRVNRDDEVAAAEQEGF